MVKCLQVLLKAVHCCLHLVGVVGFEQLEYSGVEGTSIEVCVAPFFSGTVEGIASISVNALQVLGTASGECTSVLKSSTSVVSI